jgi:stage V sporulation protein R
VRELESDVSFLRNYLTKELVDELDLYTYELRDEQWVVADRNWEHVRDQLVDSMTNFGHPTIKVEDANYENRNELLLKHYYEGRELDITYAEHALRHVFTLWGRPVHLDTVRRDHLVRLSYDGQQNTTSELESTSVLDMESNTESIS